MHVIVKLKDVKLNDPVVHFRVFIILKRDTEEVKNEWP